MNSDAIKTIIYDLAEDAAGDIEQRVRDPFEIIEDAINRALQRQAQEIFKELKSQENINMAFKDFYHNIGKVEAIRMSSDELCDACEDYAMSRFKSMMSYHEKKWCGE